MDEKDLEEVRIISGVKLEKSQIISDYDVYTKIMKLSDAEAKERVTKNHKQKIEDLRAQILNQNPQLLGVEDPTQYQFARKYRFTVTASSIQNAEFLVKSFNYNTDSKTLFLEVFDVVFKQNRVLNTMIENHVKKRTNRKG